MGAMTQKQFTGSRNKLHGFFLNGTKIRLNSTVHFTSPHLTDELRKIKSGSDFLLSYFG